MRQIIPITAIALMLATTPVVAQTVEDPTPPAAEVDVGAGPTDESASEIEGNFSRSIPEGLKGNLSYIERFSARRKGITKSLI